MWSALTLGFLVLIVLLIFIAQNTESTEFQFLGWQWSLPLGWPSCSRRWPADCWRSPSARYASSSYAARQKNLKGGI